MLLGDWGRSLEIRRCSKKWGTKDIPGIPLMSCSICTKFHDEVEANPALDDEARDAFTLLENGDKDMRHFWKQVVTITMESIRRRCTPNWVFRLITHGESFYEDKMELIIAEGKKKKIFKR